MKKRKSPKPRSTRYTSSQVKYFELLESQEINVSEWIRAAATEKMEKEIAELKNHASEPNQTLAGIKINILSYLGLTDQK